MLIIPAVDIMSGKVVRLYKGDFSKDTVYSDDPVKIAKEWEKKGAKFLHIVDLDGAREGKIKNGDIIKNVLRSVSISCEIGGGLRTDKDIEYYIRSGAQRVVLGTQAFEDISYLKKLIDMFQEKIAVSIDFSGKHVLKHGWQAKTELNPVKTARTLQDIGVKTLILTDISKDGTLEGPNIDSIKTILEAVQISVIASGGIGSIKDVKRLVDLKRQNLTGIIVGKALYEGKIDLEEAIEIASSSFPLASLGTSRGSSE